MEENLEERRQAELEFLSCAYSTKEAWWDINDSGVPVIHRRLFLSSDDFSILLILILCPGYPAFYELDIQAIVENRDQKSAALARAADKAIPRLVQSCQQQIKEGEESVLLILTHADEWVEINWPDFLSSECSNEFAPSKNTILPMENKTVLGRRLIYSHHIISKIKRNDIQNLALHYKLTGYIKIGWPGIILIEGLEENCISFYDEIRPWSWKFLVVRGEQQQKNIHDLESSRKFTSFNETDDMSVVAQHCRDVGLESLFLTSMKKYDNSSINNDEENSMPYGALVHVDHMNNAKRYRKWLRTTSVETGCFALTKQLYPNEDFTKRPYIVVVVIGESDDTVKQFLKRWRTSRVDVDSKGKSCLERMMSVVVKSRVHEKFFFTSTDWKEAKEEEQVNVSSERLISLIESIGGKDWVEALSLHCQHFQS
mmetsp:Transcript_14221/g.21016  ORF Transcript_14221/g.21016 Transcript_14221/m.21016 type:complete len:428 (-) Transcript_14221:500-1783(-)